MPNPYTHHIFGINVMERLSQDILTNINQKVFFIALNGPDDWAYYRFWKYWKNKSIRQRTGIMHHEKTGLFLYELTCLCDGSETALLFFSYLCGYICHYVLDKMMHPFIRALAGEYDDSNESEKYIGNHLAFEIEIDKYEMKKHDITMWQNPIVECFPQDGLPEEMKEGIDEVYMKVYGWNDAYKQLNISQKNSRLYYRVVQDKRGILYHCFRILGKRLPAITCRSYYYSRFEGLDVVNERHRQWAHSNDPSLLFNTGYNEIKEQAKWTAVRMITTAYEFVNNKCDDKTFYSVIGNDSYTTGFDIDDRRNKSRLKQENCLK